MEIESNEGVVNATQANPMKSYRTGIALVFSAYAGNLPRFEAALAAADSLLLTTVLHIAAPNPEFVRAALRYVKVEEVRTFLESGSPCPEHTTAMCNAYLARAAAAATLAEAELSSLQNAGSSRTTSLASSHPSRN